MHHLAASGTNQRGLVWLTTDSGTKLEREWHCWRRKLARQCKLTLRPPFSLVFAVHLPFSFCCTVSQTGSHLFVCSVALQFSFIACLVCRRKAQARLVDLFIHCSLSLTDLSYTHSLQCCPVLSSAV